jgi:hypothetical protein
VSIACAAPGSSRGGCAPQHDVVHSWAGDDESRPPCNADIVVTASAYKDLWIRSSPSAAILDAIIPRPSVYVIVAIACNNRIVAKTPKDAVGTLTIADGIVTLPAVNVVICRPRS